MSARAGVADLPFPWSHGSFLVESRSGGRGVFGGVRVGVSLTPEAVGTPDEILSVGCSGAGFKVSGSVVESFLSE